MTSDKYLCPVCNWAYDPDEWDGRTEVPGHGFPPCDGEGKQPMIPVQETPTESKGRMFCNRLTPVVCTKCKWMGKAEQCNDTYCYPTCPKCNYPVIVCAQIKTEFVKELEQLINKHSIENGSSTPDFILAHFLAGCLRSFDEATNARHNWTCPPISSENKS